MRQSKKGNSKIENDQAGSSCNIYRNKNIMEKDTKV